jgi:hypothetical protein
MNIKNIRIFTILIVSMVNIALIISPIYTAKNNRFYYPSHTDVVIEKMNTEYWALLFAVGVYRNHPDQDRPSMLEAVDNLYNILISTPEWQEDHIHVVKGIHANGQNLFKELIWLIQNEDENDMSLIYLTTHGSPLKTEDGYPIDLPPMDEADGADEILIMYGGFEKWYSFIWDDILNFFLSMLQSKGVCLIVDSCFSGGFNDLPFKGTIQNYGIESFTKGLSEELSLQNRVVLMSCEEDTVSYGSQFSFFLIEGFDGLADLYGNGDGFNSAEESFYYAQNKLDLWGYQHPTILDLYPGDFPVTS